MLKCNGKTFMNLQEAVQWLLNNNALFFMCNEDYAADTEISLEELVNPSPANPKIGSLVLFADGNIATITGITDDSFIVGSDSINIRLQKSVTNFTIDASQHLIVHYSDGTSDDLGAIFSGNVTIDGNFNVTGSINGEADPSVKPLYWHTIKVQRGGSPGADPGTSRFIGYIILLTNSVESITLSDFQQMMAIPGFFAVLHSGKGSSSGSTDLTNLQTAIGLKYKTASTCSLILRNDTNNIESTVDVLFGSGWIIFEDLGANKIN